MTRHATWEKVNLSFGTQVGWLTVALLLYILMLDGSRGLMGSLLLSMFCTRRGTEAKAMVR